MDDLFMSAASQSTRLEQLRAKTDRQLIGIIHRTLELGLRAAREASPENRAKAQKAHAEAARLLRLIYRMGRVERVLIEAKMRELDRVLARPAPLPLRARTASG